MTSSLESEHQQTGKGEDEEEEENTSCGACGFNPPWLQMMTSKKAFVLFYGLLGMNQNTIGSYFGGTLSTIEKRFRIPSSKIGMIASSWETGNLFGCMVMSYFGSSGHKARWLAMGSMVAALSCFIRFMPHMIYGPGDPPLTSSNFDSRGLCNSTMEIDEACTLESEGFTSFMIFLIAHFIIGIGTSTYETLGLAYLDDNVSKDKVPFLSALAVSIRGIGPTIGFIFASYALTFYINPSVTPPYQNDDPRWIGAWWIGWIPLGITHLVFSFIVSCYPKTLPREALRRKSAGEHLNKEKAERSFSDFLAMIKRLLHNPILMFNSFSSTFYVFGMIAYWVFIPKYMESQFRLSASEANFISGTMGVICLGFGVFSSGSFISKFRPRARYLAAWNVFTESIDTVGHLLFAFLGCPKFDLHGSYNSDGTWNLTSGCNSGCNCPLSTEYNPICSSDGTTTFYSPCHAGCGDSTTVNGTKVFTNCSCIGEGAGWARDGLCPVDCSNQFIIFLVLLGTMKFLSATGRTANTIIQFRSVQPIDKAVSLAITEVVLCTLAFIPAPIIYGFLLDSSCLVWSYTCGNPGNCWIYEEKVLRYLLNFTASSLLFIGTLFDVGVLWKIGDLQVYDEKHDQIEVKNQESILQKHDDNPLLERKETLQPFD